MPASRHSALLKPSSVVLTDSCQLWPHSPRQGGGQAGLLPVLLGEEEAREADKARLALGPSARKERGRRRRLLPIGVILRILDWAAMRGFCVPVSSSVRWRMRSAAL